MIDIRYFCDEGTDAKRCRTPVTSLPQDISALITDSALGGVVLFRENADTVLAVFGYNTYLEQNGREPMVTGPAFAALARVLTGLAQPVGTLPVSLD